LTEYSDTSVAAELGGSYGDCMAAVYLAGPEMEVAEFVARMKALAVTTLAAACLQPVELADLAMAVVV
jgi:hypothetical protein